MLREGDLVGLDFGVVLRRASTATPPDRAGGRRWSAEAQRLRRGHPRGPGRRHRRGAARAAGWATSAPRCRRSVEARGLLGGPRLRRARHRPQAARAAAGPQLRRPPAPGAWLRGRDGPGHRADGERRAARGPDPRRRLDRGDRWTGGLSAHFEHTVAVTEDGPEILTLPPDGAAREPRCRPAEAVRAIPGQAARLHTEKCRML